MLALLPVALITNNPKRPALMFDFDSALKVLYKIFMLSGKILFYLYKIHGNFENAMDCENTD